MVCTILLVLLNCKGETTSHAKKWSTSNVARVVAGELSVTIKSDARLQSVHGTYEDNPRSKAGEVREA